MPDFHICPVEFALQDVCTDNLFLFVLFLPDHGRQDEDLERCAEHPADQPVSFSFFIFMRDRRSHRNSCRLLQGFFPAFFLQSILHGLFLQRFF